MRIACALVLLVLASGCQADRNPADSSSANTTDTPAARTPASPLPGTVDHDANVAQRYACDASTSVAVMRDGSAQVSLPGGKDVELSRITGSQPPIYTGASLYFTIGDNGAHLSQQDRTNELACKLQPVP